MLVPIPSRLNGATDPERRKFDVTFDSRLTSSFVFETFFNIFLTVDYKMKMVINVFMKN